MNEKPHSSITGLTSTDIGLSNQTSEAALLKDEIFRLEAQLKSKKQKYTEVCDTILKTLELMDLESIRAHGYLFYKTVEMSVSTPKTLEDKKALFQYLEERGIFDEIVSVNSRTLQSLYKDAADAAAKVGILDFKMPGIAEPVPYSKLKLRRE